MFRFSEHSQREKDDDEEAFPSLTSIMWGGHHHHHQQQHYGYGGMGGAEMRSDIWIQQNVPGGLNSSFLHSTRSEKFERMF